jgi:protein TonB
VSYKIKQKTITTSHAKNDLKIINLQRVVVKKTPPVIIESPKLIKKHKIKKKNIKKKKIQKLKPKIVEKHVEIVEEIKNTIVQKPVLTIFSSNIQQHIEDNYLSKVKAKIESYKRYPKSAKRLRQEGVVRIDFEIGKGGEIFHAKILEGSRYKKLNSAALKILENIGAFEPIPKNLDKKSLKINVPIAYKIIES